MSGDTQLWVWMPLVIEMIGTSVSGSSGQMFRHILRDTLPCSLLPPLLTFDNRIASTVMQNASFSSSGFSRPSPIKVRQSMPRPRT